MDNPHQKYVQETSAECARFFNPYFDNKLDFSEESLKVIDTILDQTHKHRTTPEKEKWIASMTGAYIFQVAFNQYGGKFYWDEAHKQPVLVTGEPDFEISLLAFEKCMMRIANGEADNIPFFYEGYANKVKNAKPGEKVQYI
jgi:hypothetical protein